jgi:hypothetical protein
VWVLELAVVMDFAREVGVVLLRALEHDLFAISVVPLWDLGISYLGAIAEFMRCQVDLAKTSLAYKFAQCVIADGFEIGRGELTVPGSAIYHG